MHYGPLRAAPSGHTAAVRCKTFRWPISPHTSTVITIFSVAVIAVPVFVFVFVVVVTRPCCSTPNLNFDHRRSSGVTVEQPFCPSCRPAPTSDTVSRCATRVPELSSTMTCRHHHCLGKGLSPLVFTRSVNRRRAYCCCCCCSYFCCCCCCDRTENHRLDDVLQPVTVTAARWWIRSWRTSKLDLRWATKPRPSDTTITTLYPSVHLSVCLSVGRQSATTDPTPDLHTRAPTPAKRIQPSVELNPGYDSERALYSCPFARRLTCPVLSC